MKNDIIATCRLCWADGATHLRAALTECEERARYTMAAQQQEIEQLSEGAKRDAVMLDALRAKAKALSAELVAIAESER